MFVAQVFGDGESPAFLQIGLRGEEGHVGRVALRCGGQINRGVGEGNLRLRQSNKFAGLLGGHRNEESARVGQADVFARRDDQAAGDEADVFPGMEHLGQPVEGGIRIAAADALNESTDRVVVRVVFRIIDNGFALDAFLDDGAGQTNGSHLVRFGGQGGKFEGIETTPGVAIANFGQVRCGILVDRDFFRAESALGIGERAMDEGAQVRRGQGPQFEDERAGNERAVDVEERVHRRRADQAHGAALDIRQQDVLLRFVEAMDFVDEQNGAGAVAREPHRGGGHDLANLGHRALHPAEAFEAGLAGAGDDFREAGLPRAGRAVEHNGGKPVGFDRAAEKLAGTENMFLSDIFLQGPRPHPLGQWRMGGRGNRGLGGEKVVGWHGPTNLAWTHGGARRILPGYG